MTTYTFRNLPQENRYWFVGGKFYDKDGVLEWCDSLGDALSTCSRMLKGVKLGCPVDLKVVRL